MAFDTDGNLWVVLSSQSQIQKIFTSTGALSTITAPPGTPPGNDLTRAGAVAFGSYAVYPPGNSTVTGNPSLYVTSFDTNEVLTYDPNTGAFLGAFVPSGSGGLCFPIGIAFGPEILGPVDGPFSLYYPFN
jgi:hypothetical protein